MLLKGSLELFLQSIRRGVVSGSLVLLDIGIDRRGETVGERQFGVDDEGVDCLGKVLEGSALHRDAVSAWTSMRGVWELGYSHEEEAILRGRQRRFAAEAQEPG